MSTERDGNAARPLEPSPAVPEDAEHPAEATDPVVDALPRTMRAVRASIAPMEHTRFYHSDPTFGIAEGLRRSLLNFGALSVTAQLTQQIERATRFTGITGLAHVGVLEHVVRPHLVTDASLAASFAAHRGIMEQATAALGPFAQLQEPRRSLGDLLGVARLPEFAESRASLGITAPLDAFIRSIHQFEKLDAGIARMFAPVQSELFRRELLGPSLAIGRALQAWESTNPVGILAALPSVDAATLGWLRGTGVERAHIQAALVHAERVQQRQRRTRRIELPAEVPCELCRRPVFGEHRPQYITLVAAPPTKPVRLVPLCSACMGKDDEAEACGRALEALAARNSLRSLCLQLVPINGEGRGDGVPQAKGLLRLVFRRK